MIKLIFVAELKAQMSLGVNYDLLGDLIVTLKPDNCFLLTFLRHAGICPILNFVVEIAEEWFGNNRFVPFETANPG
ncbi:MAG TPA: hypothetical protein DIU00_19445 [Phycisphaerales bacterium]|nr:hypothetical protein [Phycisphaerales bacterium]